MLYLPLEFGELTMDGLVDSGAFKKKADKQIKVTEELLDHYKAINAALAEACGLALKQPITGRQYVLMTDASFRASGYALMIEEENDKKLNSKKKTFAPVAFGSKAFSPATTQRRRVGTSVIQASCKAPRNRKIKKSTIVVTSSIPKTS